MERSLFAFCFLILYNITLQVQIGSLFMTVLSKDIER